MFDISYSVLIEAAKKIAQLLFILVGCKYCVRLSGIFIDALVFKSDNQYFKMNSAKGRTLGAIVKSLLTYLLYFTAGIMILSVFEVPIGPLLASAGILGLAISFGSQNLVRDILTGFFILLEDQFSVSDYVTVSGVTGYVEELGLRVTKIRQWTGELHIIPNGLIKQVTNHSRGSMSAIVDVSIAYEENVDHVISMLEELCTAFGESREEIIEGPRVLGVQALGTSDVVIRILAKTKPMEQWKVERELRKEIKNMFDRVQQQKKSRSLETEPVIYNERMLG